MSLQEYMFEKQMELLDESGNEILEAHERIRMKIDLLAEIGRNTNK